MRTFFLIALAGILLLPLSGCIEESVTENGTNMRYFGLRNFIREEARRLATTDFQAHKSITFNHEREAQEMHNDPVPITAFPVTQIKQLAHWRHELNPFWEAAINKPAWVDKYEIDSVMREGQLNALKYRALDEDLTTRQMSVYLDDTGEVEKLLIETYNDNALYTTQQWLEYKPATGYTIDSRQKIRFFNEDHFIIEVKW